MLIRVWPGCRAYLIPDGAVVDPDVPPCDVEPVGVEGGHVNDVVVVRVAPPGLNLAVPHLQSVDVLREEGPTGRVWEGVDFAAESG